MAPGESNRDRFRRLLEDTPVLRDVPLRIRVAEDPNGSGPAPPYLAIELNGPLEVAKADAERVRFVLILIDMDQGARWRLQARTYGDLFRIDGDDVFRLQNVRMAEGPRDLWLPFYPAPTYATFMAYLDREDRILDHLEERVRFELSLEMLERKNAKERGE